MVKTRTNRTVAPKSKLFIEFGKEGHYEPKSDPVLLYDVPSADILKSYPEGLLNPKIKDIFISVGGNNNLLV